ncbi:hypothetical protein L9F63_020083, partial [Diploptera punctata]
DVAAAYLGGQVSVGFRYIGNQWASSSRLESMALQLIGRLRIRIHKMSRSLITLFRILILKASYILSLVTYILGSPCVYPTRVRSPPLYKFQVQCFSQFHIYP